MTNWGDWEEKRAGKAAGAAVYARVSTTRQADDDRQSLPVQIDFARAKINEIDPSHVWGFIDPGKSGMTWDNRKVKYITDLVTSGKVKFVITFDVSRLGRYAPETIGFFAKCLKLGAVIVTPTRTYDWSMESILVYVVNAVGDQTSNMNRRKASMDAKERRFQLGFYNKKIPFGYRRVKQDGVD